MSSAPPFPARLRSLQVPTVALICALAAWVGFRVLSVPGSLPILWPSAGLLLGALLILPRRSWIATAAAAWTATAVLQVAMGASLTATVALSGIGSAAAWVLARGWPLMARRPSRSPRRRRARSTYWSPTW